MQVEFIDFATAEPLLNWQNLGAALVKGHSLPHAEIKDTLLYRGDDTLLSRAAWIDGLGLAVKSATIFPGNGDHGLPSVNGAVNLYADTTGVLEAIVDFHLVTKWKTAGDSLLAATRLARPDSKVILIIGAGTVGQTLYQAYSSAFPDARFQVWNRSATGAARMAEKYPAVQPVSDLEVAVKGADIIASATMTTEPMLKGAWLQPGQHVDLIGAYRPDMHEIDAQGIQCARVFVDSRDTTLDHIGDLKTPLERGEIARDHIVADYYDLASGDFARRRDDEITVFKNGGGAHLDLMTSCYILEAWNAR